MNIPYQLDEITTEWLSDALATTMKSLMIEPVMAHNS